MPRPKNSKVVVAPTPKKRIRRTEDQLIADLQEEIERLKTKAAAKAAKKNPSIKYMSNAVRSIDEASAHATDSAQRQALSEARTVLVAYLQLEGVKIPQKRGRKPGWSQNAAATAEGQED
jgi:hypothetical protein